LRLATRRLISLGSTPEELGDRLLPYVVVDNVDDLARLQHLGVELLEDAPSASPNTLVRALVILGESLSTDWGQKEIIESRARWRLVRGAIQEIYRSLNQSGQSARCPSNARLASRSPSGVAFKSLPLFYAEPGSAIEQAFQSELPLFDADRPYPNLFKQFGITRLQEGSTVKVRFDAGDRSVRAERLRDEITNRLGPYLLASIMVRADASKASDLVVRRLRERFEVKATDRLMVSFSLVGDSTIARTVDFAEFYLQREVIQSSGSIEEAHFTLNVKGNENASIDVLDADALGQSIVPLFLDSPSDELAGLFPRIASRYQHLKGSVRDMEDYMYFQLGISREAQEAARAILIGEAAPTHPISIPPPPPAKIVTNETKPGEESLKQEKKLREDLLRHQEQVKSKANDLVQRLIDDIAKGEGKKEPSPPKRPDDVSPAQKERGLRGEEEIMRRLQLPGGYMGFTFIADKREPGNGYDFQCFSGESEVKLEVKTFTTDGRIFMTPDELQQAAISQDHYYLVGILDDGAPEYGWKTCILRNPLDILLAKGSFDLQAKLKAKASEVFEIQEENA
jgi:Protein NO VEIN, C-terminal